METITFSTIINATKEKVWHILWDDASYRQWTVPFCEGSHAITDHWKEGSKVLFLSPGANGMVSRVAKNMPNDYMSFEHLGVVKKGMEDTTSDGVKLWAGAHENYTLKENEGVTELVVDMNITDEFKDYFVKTFPLALDNIKALAEGKPALNKLPQTFGEQKISAGGVKQKIVPFLWYDGMAEDAAIFYTGIFKNSKITSTSPGPDGKAFSVTFQLEGQDFYALNGGPMFKFTEAISLFINCEGQEEVDHYWEKLSEGGEKSRCGWLKDKFGLSWQVIPTDLGRLISDPDPAKSKRVLQAMMQMSKIDIAQLKEAYDR